MLDKFPDEFVLIDATQEPDVVTNSIIGVIEKVASARNKTTKINKAKN
jgi:hypothetical protein